MPSTAAGREPPTTVITLPITVADLPPVPRPMDRPLIFEQLVRDWPRRSRSEEEKMFHLSTILQGMAEKGYLPLPVPPTPQDENRPSPEQLELPFPKETSK